MSQTSDGPAPQLQFLSNVLDVSEFFDILYFHTLAIRESKSIIWEN